MSDSDSSPKSPSSSSSSGDDEKDRSSGDGGGGSARGHSSDESTASSDAVLVELPSSRDRDRCSQSPPGDSEGGILVDIDGSMLEHSEDNGRSRTIEDESGREETFVDAPEQLVNVRSSVDLSESVALIEIGESSSLQTQLNDALAQCHTYKEEREVIAKDITNLQRVLRELIDRRSSDNEATAALPQAGGEGKGETWEFSTPATLHSVFDDCSKSAYRLGIILDEHLNSEGMVRELQAILYTKDQEIGELNSRGLECSISRDVIESYLTSVRDVQHESERELYDGVIHRLSCSLSSMVGLKDDSSLESNRDPIMLIERQTMMLIEKHEQILSEIEELKVILEELKPDVFTTDKPEPHFICNIVRDQLLESKRKESYFQENQLIETNCKLVEDGDKMKASFEQADEEKNKFKVGLEQAESKLAAAKEKLSIAVTKGKSLVQHRDSLKQSLAEKDNELGRCMLELQHRSDAFVESEATSKRLILLLAEKTSELEKCQHELEKKSETATAAESRAGELTQSLTEKTGELENCKLEMQQKSNAMMTMEMRAEELLKILEEKDNKLQNCLQELEEKSIALVTAEDRTVELNKIQDFAGSLQESLMHKDKLLQEIEEIMYHLDHSDDLASFGIIDKIRWLVDQKPILDAVSLESQKIKEALSSVDLPEEVKPLDFDSQIYWLGNSLSYAKANIIKLQGDIVSALAAAESHESKHLEALKEVEHLTTSFLGEKESRHSLQAEINDLKSRYEGIAEKLSVVSNEKDGLIKALISASGYALDDEPPCEVHEMFDKCIEKIKEQTALSPCLERIHSLLYVRDVELMVCEKMLEEATFDRSEIICLSNDLEKSSMELAALRNEKDSMQKELERLEEKSSLLREKLSMAVKKGKGLVQEREGLKISLEEKNSEIKKLKHELDVQHSVVSEYKNAISTLSGFPDQIQKLDEDMISLRAQTDDLEQCLIDSNNQLQKLSDSIKCISLPTDRNFENPVERVNWMEEYLHELEDARTHLEKELQKAKDVIILHSNKLVDASTTIKSLDGELLESRKQNSLLLEEIKEMQAGKDRIEQELKKMKEESFTQSAGLEHAYATIKALEKALLQANTNVSLLEAEKREMEADNKQQTYALNTKLAECMEELGVIHRSSENQLAEMASNLEHLRTFFKDEGLFLLITEIFRTKIERLSNMDILIQEILDQIADKRIRSNPIVEKSRPDSTLSSLPNFDAYVNAIILKHRAIAADFEDSPSLTKFVEGLQSRDEFLVDLFNGLSKHMDNHITFTSHALQETRAELPHLFDFIKLMERNVDDVEAQKHSQEIKMLSLQKEVKGLLSVCSDTAVALQIDFNDFLEFSYESIQQEISVKPMLNKVGDTQLEAADAGEYDQEVGDLINSARNQSQRLASAKQMWISFINGLREKLKQAELSVEAALQDKFRSEARVSKLEQDLESLQNVCDELKVSIEEYQLKEITLRNKEAEIISFHTQREKRETNRIFTESQEDMLIENVNKMEIPFKELEKGYEEVYSLSPVDKVFYIIEKASAIQNKMNAMIYEKEDMELFLASNLQETEKLKKECETMRIMVEDLEPKKIELSKLASGLKRMLQNFGASDLLEYRKTATTEELLSTLEKLTSSSSIEFENTKSRVQELGAMLHEKEKAVDDLTAKVKLLEDSINSWETQPDMVKERTVFEASTSEISEIDDPGSIGKSTKSSVAAAHARPLRKGSSDHLVLRIDPESERLVTSRETDKGHVFKSLKASGLIPKQGISVADRIDGIWVSGGRMLMSRPRARLGLIGYWLLIHLWVLGTIL